MAKERVMVQNMGDEIYTEEYNGSIISIPTRGSVTMNRKEAVHFLGKFSGCYPKGHPSQGKMREKNLVIIPIDGPASNSNEEPKYVSHLDGREFETKEELNRYLDSIKEKAIKEEKNPEDTREKELTNKKPLATIPCPFCSMMFHSKETLLSHMRVHVKERKK